MTRTEKIVVGLAFLILAILAGGSWWYSVAKVTKMRAWANDVVAWTTHVQDVHFPPPSDPPLPPPIEPPSGDHIPPPPPPPDW